jgi:hypothetical protein
MFETYSPCSLAARAFSMEEQFYPEIQAEG